MVLSSYFFENKKKIFSDFFDKKINTWELIPQISEYLTFLFTEKKIKGNYSSSIFVENSAQIDSAARIVGPAYIGRKVTIEYNAYIRENVLVGDESKIRHGSEIKNSVILFNSSLSHFNYVAESLIGDNVRIGAGAKIANRRLDRKNIIVHFKDKKIDTKLTRFGSIIGDDTKIGVNSVVNPGTILEKNCLVYPLVSISGYNKENSVIK